MEPYLIRWFEGIKKGTEENRRLSNLEREAQAVNRLNKQRELARRTKPLAEQIEELMRSLPPSLRDRPWSMAELVSRLQGKYRDRPHPQHVGIALAHLGWHRERRWGKGYDGARIWLPPVFG
jgi:hypothetical protein